MRTKKHTKLVYKIDKLLMFIFCFLVFYFAFPQQSEMSNIEQQLDHAKSNTPKSYQDIDALFSEFKRDSLKMQDLHKWAKAQNNTEVQSYALNALGVLARNSSFYESAIQFHKQGEALALDANNPELQVINLNNIGVVYRRMDMIKPALDFHTKALDIARSIDNPSEEIQYNIAVSQNSIGNIYLVLEQYDLAMRQFKKSLKIEESSGNRLGLAINYQNIGFAYEAQGDFENALRNYKRSLDYNNQINSDIGRVICYNSIGQVYIKQEQYEDAKVLIKEALEKAKQVGDQFYIASSYINLGWAQRHLNEFRRSESSLLKGLNVAETFGLKLSTVEAKQQLSELYEATNRPSEALTLYRDAVNLEKTISNDRNLRYVNDVIIQYENEAKNKQIQALADENELVRSRLERNKKVFWYSMLALLVIGAVLVALYRNRQLQQEKQILTLEQDMLRSQMNPHFIFNSLNSIKLYIINNEKENAVYYLNKFSKLIRKILVASTEKEISLEDELDTMKLYMNIENIRFSNEIDFQVHIDDSINPASVKVPSMILQPFLENALWHGLSSKKEDDKEIKLTVFQNDDDYVTITIEDNGIGRVAAAKINENKLLKRKSVGLSLTKARLANFSKDFTMPYKLRIEDLYNDVNQASGTRVVVDIPTRSNILKTA